MAKIRTVYIRRDDILACRVAIGKNARIRVTDFTRPAAPALVSGRVVSIDEDPRHLVPIRWCVTLELDEAPARN